MNAMMSAIWRIVLVGFVSAGFVPGLLAKEAKSYGDPKRFEKDIQAFEAEDAKQPPPAGAIVCVGSSSMRFWRDTIKEDLAPLTVIPRGFGGSMMNDALYYADRIVFAYKPRAIVIYEGDNDIGSGIAPETVAETFHAFVAKTHEKLPDARIYVICIKPSIKRWSMWSKMKQANDLIAAECTKDKLLTYIDVATPMIGADGKPLPDIFREDKLHMTRKGYEIWRDTVRPVLLKSEGAFEKK